MDGDALLVDAGAELAPSMESAALGNGMLAPTDVAALRELVVEGAARGTTGGTFE
jgi:hypothetical protein